MMLKSPSRRLLWALGGLGVLSGLVLVDGYRVAVSRYRFSLRGLAAPLKLVHLSDLHYGLYIREASLRAWVDAALAEAPDLIVMTGDFIDANRVGSLKPLVRQLSRLKAPLGVWGVWGNHDYRGYRTAALRRELTRSGLRLLRNEGTLVREDLFLAGVDDLWRGKPDLSAALKDKPEGVACLLLSHNPDLLPLVPPAVGLTLCGHTHGGQVKLPLIGPIVTSSIYGKRFAEGWIAKPVNAFVSRGLGFSSLPLRFNCRAEVVTIELEPA